MSLFFFLATATNVVRIKFAYETFIHRIATTITFNWVRHHAPLFNGFKTFFNLTSKAKKNNINYKYFMQSFKEWLLFESSDVMSVVENFLKSETGVKNQKMDCKTVTRAFLDWANKNRIKADVLLLAPPSAETIKNRPELKGKSGEGDSHIMPVVDGNTIDFTARQFPAQRGRPYDKPLITPIGNVEKVYKQIGGYYTDAPEYFGTGTPYYLGPWSGMPSFFNKNFSDELM